MKALTAASVGRIASPVKRRDPTELCGRVAAPRSSSYFEGVKTAVLKAEQFITDAGGKRVGVLLDLRAYERLCEAEEELADIQAYDKAQPAVRAEIASGHFVTLAGYRGARTKRRK